MLQICVIGAGFSGICMGVSIKRELKNCCKLTIFDENGEFGGVWLKNTYPGSAEEVPSHLYSFSFEPNPDWTFGYCRQDEILSYLINVAKKYDLYANAKFHHKVDEMQWDHASCKWKIFVTRKTPNYVQEQKTFFFDIIIDAHGRFSNLNIPEEYRNFNGTIIHSGQWNHSENLNGKNVLVVGCGASGAQIVPEIAQTVEHLFVYQRHAPWVMPKRNFKFPEIVKWVFTKVPWVQKAYRRYLYWLFERNISGFKIGSLANRLAPYIAKFHLWRQVNNPQVRKQLIPNVDFGCKRIVNSSEYYPTFNRQNVTLISEKIEISENSIITSNGNSHKLDVIILATGFQVENFFGDISFIGKNFVNIPKMWINDKPRSYMSIMNSAAPNFFMLLGPNSSTGYTSIILQLETQVKWVIKVINELVYGNYKLILVKESAQQNYMSDLENKAKKTVFGSAACANSGSWYLNTKGDVIEIFPDSTRSYENMTDKIKLSDFVFE